VPSEPSYDLVVAALAVRAIAEELPEAVAVASIDLITGPLLENPDRTGHRLGQELKGLWSARRARFE
jgi:hypothetical protein